MSPRRLSGWEPATVTRYEYDGDRLIRSVTVSEAEWSPEDVAVLIASRLVEHDRGPHGFPMSEATDPANQFAFVGQEAPVVDYAEKARRDTMDAYRKRWDTKENPLNQNGHIWGVTKRPTT